MLLEMLTLASSGIPNEPTVKATLEVTRSFMAYNSDVRLKLKNTATLTAVRTIIADASSDAISAIGRNVLAQLGVETE